MLLCFSLGDERFALDTKGVQKVVPLVQLKKIPNAPAWVAGVMRYHGQLVPVIDLCALNIQQPAARQMSTRIMVIDYAAADGSSRLLGLMAEKVTEILRRSAEEFSDPGVQTPDAPWLGGIASDNQEMIQLITAESLLPTEVQTLLFMEPKEAGR